MTGNYSKYPAYQILSMPTKLFGYPKTEDKINTLNGIRSYAGTSDVNYIFPLVFHKSKELSFLAARVVSEIMGRVRGKKWNSVYDEIKYVKIEYEAVDKLLDFQQDISIHLLGAASLNSNGYVREKALKLMSRADSKYSVPYILLRLNDWVLPVRNTAEKVLENFLTADNTGVFLDNFWLIEKLGNVMRTDLDNVRQKIGKFILDEAVVDKLMIYLRHKQVKTRLFCYKLFENTLPGEEEVVNLALKDKSFEVRLWLVEAIRGFEPAKRTRLIGELLNDRSSRVVTAVMRKYEDIASGKFSQRIEQLLVSEHASIRDDARFLAGKYLYIKDFPGFYRKQIGNRPVPGALLGLGETGSKEDFQLVSSFYYQNEPEMRQEALTAMWYLSKEGAADYLLKALASDLPKVRRTAKKLLKKTRLPVIIFEMKNRLEYIDPEIKLFALKVLCSYGGWHALEGILFALTNWQEQEAQTALSLLDSWVKGSAGLYSMPDSNIRVKLLKLYETLHTSVLIPGDSLRELDFLLKTRNLLS
jgi:HEAT repeat protein